MPTRFRPGTGQLGITGIPKGMIEEFKKLCKGAGQNGRDLSYGEMFEIVFQQWKEYKNLDAQGLSRKGLGLVAEPKPIYHGDIHGLEKKIHKLVEKNPKVTEVVLYDEILIGTERGNPELKNPIIKGGPKDI